MLGQHNSPAVQEWDCLNLEYGTYTIYQPRLVKIISSELYAEQRLNKQNKIKQTKNTGNHVPYIAPQNIL
jgi:hypothetical protein